MTPDRLYIAPSVRTLSFKGESILHNLYNGRWVKIPKFAVTAIQQLATGKVDLESLRDKGITLEEFKELVNLLVEFQFLTENPDEPFTPPLFPIVAYLNVTDRCNLRCKTCYFAAKKESTTTEMSTQEIKIAMNKLQEAGIKYLIIAGGEPLIREDLYELFEYASGLFHEVTLLTNGTLIDEDAAAKIADSTKVVQVSLDGPDEITNRQIRGKGSFSKAIRGIRLLKSAGVNVLIVCTVTKINIPTLPRMAALARSLDAELGSSIFLATGHGACNKKCLSPAWQNLLQDFCDEIFQLNRDEKLNDSQYTATSNLRIGLSCGSGTLLISIAPDGNIYPCHVLHKPEFQIGNILSSEPLTDILETSSVVQQFKELHVENRPLCRRCNVRYFCRGGCIAQGLASTNSLKGKDKFCPLFKKVFRAQVWMINDHMTDKQKAEILLRTLA